MRRVFFALGVLVLICLAPQPASAGPIIDPIIGVRGCAREICGSDDVDSGLVNIFNPADCPEGYEGFSCVVYRVTEGFSEGINRLAVEIASIPPSELEFEPPGEGDPPSEFGFFVDDNGDVVFTGEGALQCGGGIETDTHNCTTNEEFFLYLRPLGSEAANLVYTSRVTQVNDTPIAPAAPVPEPGSMLLLGTGLATLAAKARRKVLKVQ